MARLRDVFKGLVKVGDSFGWTEPGVSAGRAMLDGLVLWVFKGFAVATIAALAIIEAGYIVYLIRYKPYIFAEANMLKASVSILHIFELVVFLIIYSTDDYSLLESAIGPLVASAAIISSLYTTTLVLLYIKRTVAGLTQQSSDSSPAKEDQSLL